MRWYTLFLRIVGCYRDRNNVAASRISAQAEHRESEGGNSRNGL